MPACLCVSVCNAAGPADMGFSFGLHVQQDYDLPAMMASPQMQAIYSTTVEVRPNPTNSGRVYSAVVCQPERVCPSHYSEKTYQQPRLATGQALDTRVMPW
jgi:hypothetical protein